MMHAATPPFDIAILGAGIIGLSCAWELARRGADVAIYDKNWPPRGASWAAAGMLAPAYEVAGADDAHPQMLSLCLESRRMWEGFASDLSRISGIDVGYRAGPSLAIAHTEADAERLARLAGGLKSAGQPANALDRAAWCALEPALGPSVTHALALPTDGQVDNRFVIDALIIACKKAGVAFVSYAPVGSVTVRAGGWRSPGCQPVKGQLLSLAPLHDGPERLIQCDHTYIVPKSNRIVIGATSEPGATDCGSVFEETEALRTAAVAICPALGKAAVLERWAGIRPASPDGAPIIGALEDGSLLATGHYRNGILLAPITAKIIADLILKGETIDGAEAFSPKRFQTATA